MAITEPQLPLYLSQEELLHICQREHIRINKEIFNYRLPEPTIEFSTRMRTCAGKCFPAHRRIRLNLHHYYKDGLEEFLRTFRHECIHLLIPNHGPEFQKYAKLLDVDTYWQQAPSRKPKPWKYWAICPMCGLGVSKKVKRKTPSYCPNCRKKLGVRVQVKYRKITVAERKKYGL